MSTLDTEVRPADWLGPDPGPRIRQIVALMLRMALGVSLLSAGMARHLGARMTNQVPGMVMLDGTRAFLSGLAYFQIGLGLALILGFLITASALGACLHLLVLPAYQMVMEVSAGRFVGMWNDPYVIATTQMLPVLMIPTALTLWLSPVANHPFSIDALIFARSRDVRAIRPPMMVIDDDPTPA